MTSPVKAGLWPPPPAADGLDRVCRPAVVCHHEIDGKVWPRGNFKPLVFGYFQAAVDSWQGGANETIEVRQRPKRQDAIRYPDTFVAKIRDMAKLYHDGEIIDLLKSEGLTSSTGKPFTLSMIRWIRHKHHIPSPLPPAGTLTVGQVRQRYGVSLWVVHYWIERGIVSAAHRKRNTPYAITINVDVDRRLRECVANSGHLRRVTPNAN